MWSVPILVVLLLVLGCAPERHRADMPPAELPVSVQSDSFERFMMPTTSFGKPAGNLRLTLERVSPTRAELDPALPEGSPMLPPATDPDAMTREGLVVDDELRPPIARDSRVFVLRAARRGWVELDVRVDEQGEVSDAVVVQAEADSATQAAALEAAYAVRFHPAVQRGRPVAVWCRQRFEVGR